jgi:hypothetical protein
MTRQVRGSGESARPARRDLVAILATAVALSACTGSGDDSSATFASTVQDGGGHDATGGPSHVDAGAAEAAAPDDATLPEAAAVQDAGVPAAMLSASALDLGAVGCSQSATQMLTVTNGGTGLLAVNGATTGVAFSVFPTSLSLEPGASGVLTVTASIPGSASAGISLGGSLQLFTNDPAQPSVSIALTAKPTGATLTYSPTSPTKASFPSTETSTPASPIALYLVNTGNAPANVSFGPPSDAEFSLSGTGTGGTPTTLAAGGAVAVTAGFTPAATTTASVSASSTVSVSGTTCGTSVSSLSFAGSVGYGQIAGWPTGPIDFGPADCGGNEPMYQLVVLTNSGGVNATITSATITGAPGFTSFAQGVVIPAGGSGAFAVHAPAVPALSPTTPVSATLTIQTDAETASHTITLTEEPRGAVLAFDTSATPNFGSFGQVVLLQAASQNFSVVNTGTGPATVTLSTGSGGSPFAVSTPTFSIPANGTQTDAVTFVPTSAAAGASTGSITMTATGVCAAPPAPLPLSGATIGGGPAVTPTSLSFVASCGGAAPAAQTFTVSNKGNANLNWSMSGVTGAGSAQYKVSAAPPPGLLMPGQSATVTVTAAAIPSPAPNLSPSAYAAQLVITTDVPFDDPHPVTLGETPLGDQLSFSVPNLRFGQFPINTSTIAETFTVTNNANPGSPAANVSLGLSGAGAGAYSLSPTSIANLGPSGSVSSPASVMFRPTTPAAYPATVALTTSDSLCTALPSPIQLSGTGTQGKVSVSATTLAFGTDTTDASGLVNCGATGTAQTFTVSNAGNQQFNITGLSLGMGANSPYVLSGDATTLPATIPIGGSTTITVTPNAIPSAVANPNDASPFTDTLTVTTDAALDSPHKIALVMQARGAVIANTPLATSWAFGTLGNGLIGTFSNTITNTGNAAASVSFQGLQHPTVFGLQSAPTIAAANAVTDVIGQFSPPATNQLWTDQGTLVVTAAQAFCEPLPSTWSSPTIALSGSSISGSLPVTVSGSLAFPSTSCGSAAPAAQSITLTNTTNVAYVFTAQLNSGQFYTLQNPTQNSAVGDASAGIIPGNGVVVLGVTPQTVTPGPGAVAGSAPYADDLVVNIESPTPSGVTIPISWTLDGAMLSLPQGLGPNKDAMGNPFYVADSQSGFTLPMDNSGTGTATVQFGVQPNNAFSFSPTPPVAVEPNIRALPRLISSGSDATCPSLTSGSATFLYSGPVCRPFPFAQVSIQSCVGTF